MSNNAKQKKYDVIIIGAGVSGLSAAYRLAEKKSGLSYLILEANDRVGGRTIGQTLKTANGTDTWDLGGQWIGKCQPHVMAMVQELGLEVYDQFMTGTKVMQLGNSAVSTYKSDIPSLPVHALIDLHLFMRKMEKMCSQVPTDDPSLCPHAAEWDNITFQTFMEQQMWTKGAKEAVEAAGRTVFGQEAGQVSLLYYLLYSAAAGGLEPLISSKPGVGGQELRVKGGAYQVCGRLEQAVGSDNICLGQPVTSITQQENGVIVKTLTGDSFEAQHVILATPPNQTGRILFAPPLPINKQHVLSRMPMGNLTKVIVTYAEAFWRDDGYSGEAVTNGGAAHVSGVSRGPLCTMFDATTCNGNPAIVSFIGGDQQLEYATLSPQLRKSAVLRSIADFFGDKALDCVDYAEKNWNHEPYSGGCPVCVGTPGMMTHFAPALREPCDRLHFAGTESATVWCGFINGAIQAGQRAATEVLHTLRPDLVTPEELSTTCYALPPPLPPSPTAAALLLRPHVLRWTIGLGAVCVALAVGKKAYFRIAL